MGDRDEGLAREVAARAASTRVLSERLARDGCDDARVMERVADLAGQIEDLGAIVARHLSAGDRKGTGR
jgi:hypothetical protein